VITIIVIPNVCSIIPNTVPIISLAFTTSKYPHSFYISQDH